MGCQLIGGQLECVPGMDHLKPQQQINVLKQQIDATSQRATELQAAVQSLGEPELAGEAIAGELIEARWLAANPGGPQPTLIHWYRQGESGWLLIPGAVGSSYTGPTQRCGPGSDGGGDRDHARRPQARGLSACGLLA